MIKKLALLGLAAFLPAATHAFSPVRYVQISTNTISRQNGSYNVQAGTAAVILTSTLTVTSSSTFQGAENFVGGSTFNGAVTFSTNVIDGSATQGTAGQSLQSNAGSAPTWVNIPSAILTSSPTFSSSVTVNNAVKLGATGLSVTISSNTIFPGATFYQNADAVFTSTISFSPTTTGIRGTTTNDNANAGDYGEYISSTCTSATITATTVFGDPASITLTVGDWDLFAICDWSLNGATMTGSQCGISTTSGNSATGLNLGQNQVQVPYAPNGTYDSNTGISKWRRSLGSQTTFFLKQQAIYSAGAPLFSGTLAARRVR